MTVAIQRRPLKLTMKVEKLDRVMADVQLHINERQLHMSNLKLARERIVWLHAMGYGVDPELPSLSVDLLRGSEAQEV